jgi:putative membrane protein
MGWMGAWMWLGWIVGLGLLVLLVWAVARAAGSPTAPRQDDSPETILKRRYASGEIDREEYERRLTDLRR